MAEQSNVAAGVRPFEISRTYDAPRSEMWKAWTEAERMARWWGPKGFDTHIARLDARPGGTCHYLLRASDGMEMWGKLTYEEIAAPERLVFDVAFSDAAGGVTRHPWEPSWPLHMLSTVTLTEQGGKTTVAVRWVPTDATAEERKTFDEGHDDMRQGWTGTLDRLGDYLTKG